MEPNELNFEQMVHLHKQVYEKYMIKTDLVHYPGARQILVYPQGARQLDHNVLESISY